MKKIAYIKNKTLGLVIVVTKQKMRLKTHWEKVEP